MSSTHSSGTATQGATSGNRKATSQTLFSLQSAPRRRPRRHLFLDLPIAWRLTLGFLVAALIAALVAGFVGLQRSQSLSKQTDFYHHLLQVNTSLTSGRGFLELMNSKLHQTLDDANATNPSSETLATDTGAIANLTRLYAQTLNTYAQTSLLDQHPDQLALLDEAGESGLATQQRTLLNSAQRTWQVYQDAQEQILTYISNNDLNSAQLVLQQQGEPTNADALSALHSLIQLNDRLAFSVDDATSIEIHNELLITIISTICAFAIIVLVGWFISNTLIRRLHYLHRVTRAVEEGRTSERVDVIGRDEIAQVSDAVNAMIDTITGLLEETRQQRDALAGAAEHLFSDMRIVNAGDLRINATVSNDPIGMLANAFNFTVGRFRRFILRTQTNIEQLEVVARQSQERSNAFMGLVRTNLRDVSPPRPPSQALPTQSASLAKGSQSIVGTSTSRPALRKPALQSASAVNPSQLTRQVQQNPDELIRAVRDELNQRLGTTRETVQAANQSISRLSELISTRPTRYSGNLTEKMTQTQLQELVILEQLLSKLAWELQQTQFTSANNFTKIDTALTRLAAEHPTSSGTETSEGSATDPQFQDFLRQAGSFAVEVNVFSQRLVAIIQEMRSSVTPFRLEGAANMGDLTKSFSSSSPSEQF
jgi:methyl-accepting chemotaxis protein